MKQWNRLRRWAWAGILVAWLLGSASAPGESGRSATETSERTAGHKSADEPDPAELKISGYGFLGNRRLKKSLDLLKEADEPPPYYDANFVEDATMLLFSTIKRDGYLEPEIEATLQLADGTEEIYVWEQEFESLLPRPLKIQGVRFQIRKGTRFYYDSIEFSGLQALEPDQARSYLVETGALLPLKSTRIFTPTRLEKSVGNLREELVRRGYVNAAVHVADLRRDDETGAVDVQIKVTQGRRWMVRSMDIEIDKGKERPVVTETREIGEPYSEFWLQGVRQSLRSAQYQKGYPDAKVEIVETEREVTNGDIFLDLLAQVRMGPQVEIGEIRFEGHEKTREAVMRGRVWSEPGDLLNRIELEEARGRLSRLGVFERVSVRYEQETPEVRNVVYDVEEGKRIDFSVLFGYGSYDLVWGGFEVDHYNVFGRAHHSRLRAKQSLRSTMVDYLYSTPELTRRNISLFFMGTGLRREEIDFTRRELSASVGGKRQFQAIDSDVSLRYNYELLGARDAETPFATVDEDIFASSIILDVQHDQRDNPLLPASGYRIGGDLEWASAALGGEVDYQRVAVRSAYHHSFDGGRFLHFGMGHGMVFVAGGSREELPINKRFFPGGQNSVRGFQRGEAAPRNERGRLIGAETFLRGNVEFEQALTPTWSVVGFVDGVGFSEDLADYPMEEQLFSVGGGIRWKTFVGPVRLEYGHNLNPREDDPPGTIHFSIGSPF